MRSGGPGLILSEVVSSSKPPGGESTRRRSRTGASGWLAAAWRFYHIVLRERSVADGARSSTRELKLKCRVRTARIAVAGRVPAQ